MYQCALISKIPTHQYIKLRKGCLFLKQKALITQAITLPI